MTDPAETALFELRDGDAVLATFGSASGLGARVDVIAYREAGAARRLPAQPQMTPLVLRHGTGVSRDLLDWCEASLTGLPTRRILSLAMRGDAAVGGETLWTLFDAWPSSVRFAALDAGSPDSAIEELTLVYARIERR
jgi:phage tail-like protein